MTKDPSSPFFPSSEVTSNFTRSVSASALEAAAASSTAAKAALRISFSFHDSSARSAPLCAWVPPQLASQSRGLPTDTAERNRGTVIAPDETVDETGLLAPTGGAPREFG